MSPPPPPPSCSSSNSPHLSRHFTPIEEGDETEDCSERRRPGLHPTPSPLPTSTPTSTTTTTTNPSVKKRSSSEKVSVICTNCRPTTRDKTTTSSVVPLSMPSPNAFLKSLLSSVSRRTPKQPSPDPTTSPSDRWKIAVSELSHKLVHATKKRDDALLEASHLKSSLSSLESKLTNLELYCHSLKSNIEGAAKISPFHHLRIHNHDHVISSFLTSVSESRSAVRLLSRALTIQIRQTGPKLFDRIAALFHPYDIKISLSKNPRNLISYLEALLNLALFEDFESIGFAKSSVNRILNPLDRCEAQYAAFSALRGLTWEEVLSKGTKHFSEDFSRFCDRKMSEIVGMLGWNRAWPEPLLQAFFGASKSVWLVHLLANSVHPGLPIFRVEKGSEFDAVYMEDMGGDRTAHRLVPTGVRIMVAPGFYVYDNVVKCKVLCRYHSSSSSNNYVKGISP